MKALCIRYYSSTGNTKRAIEELAKELERDGVTVDVAALGLGTPGTALDKKPSELLIGFSIFGFGAAHSLRASLARLPPGEGRRAHLLAVCGAEMKEGRRVPGWPGQAVEQVEAILKRRNYEVVSSSYVSYPVNWVQFFTPIETVDIAGVLEEGDEEVRAYARSMLAGTAGLYRCGRANRLWNVPTAWLFDAVGRRFLGNIYMAGPECNGCGLCARSCPAAAIRMKGGVPAWKASCDACNRCINVCPKRAIQASNFKLALDLLLSALAIWACFPLARIALGGLGIAYLGAWEVLIALVLATAATPLMLAILIGPVDALVRLAARWPAFRRLAAAGPSKKHGRYLAPGFAPKGEARP